MMAAMKAVVEGSSSVSKAAREYGVPRTTLQNRIEFFTELNLGLSLTWPNSRK